MTWGEGLAITIEVGIALLVYILSKLGLLPTRKPKEPADEEPADESIL
jgi:hypothetical protein